MRAFDGRKEPDGGSDKGAQWVRRELKYPGRPTGASSEVSTRLMERVAARVGFDSFERVFVALTAIVVLAGCVIMFKAAASGPDPQAAIEPSIIIAKQEKTAEPQQAATPSPAVAPATAPVAETTAPTASSLAGTPSMLSQTPLRESAREALARPPAPTAEEPVRETSPQTAPSTEALGYAETGPEIAPPAAAALSRETKNEKAEGEKVARCLVKVSGRTLNSGPCRVFRNGQAVTLSFGGGDVTVSPHRGREWTLSVGGRSVGKVYKSGGCWGSRNHTWVCERA